MHTHVYMSTHVFTHVFTHPYTFPPVDTPGRTHLIQSPGGTRYPVDTTQAPYQDKTHKRPQEHPWETPQGTPKKERVLLQDETRPTPPTLKTPLSHKSVNTPNARDKGKAPEVTAANKGLDGVFKTAQEASLDAAKHINMIAGIHSALPVTMMYEETYRDELCEPGQVFYKLPHIERCALVNMLKSHHCRLACMRCVCVCLCLCACVRVCPFVTLQSVLQVAALRAVCAGMYMYVCMYMYIYIWIYMYVHVCI